MKYGNKQIERDIIGAQRREIRVGENIREVWPKSGNIAERRNNLYISEWGKKIYDSKWRIVCTQKLKYIFLSRTQWHSSVIDHHRVNLHTLPYGPRALCNNYLDIFSVTRVKYNALIPTR